MSSLSSFDDLLNELDGPSATPGQDREDPLRTSCLKQLVELSTRLEKVAQILDPSESKHPLFKQTIPAEQRAHLKQLVGELMRVQGELQKIEEGLLQENTLSPSDSPSESVARPSLNEPPSIEHEDELLPPRKRNARPEPEPVPVNDPVYDKKAVVEEPIITPQEAEQPVLTSSSVPPPVQEQNPVAPVAKNESLEKEQQEFAAYKTQWEAAFAQDPSLREAHPEVAAYYEQMEKYFHEKEQHLKTSTPLDSTP